MERRTGQVAIGGAVIATLIVLAYPLSTGPAVWLVHHGYVSKETKNDFYEPLWIVAGKIPHGDAVLTRYIRWWRSTVEPTKPGNN